ncbi:MAG: maleylpyruvate isomerase N-terminal domain-containing protein [Ilumatobacteraceae bacterium]|nr:MAG: maleylpyruvate isomerase N-terminal domain-containing protein [Actinomycetota bacterium]
MRAISADVEAARRSHERLLAALSGHDGGERLGDAHVGLASLLPGWTVGHVLTHIARNADGHRRMLDAASRGEIAEQYPAFPGGDSRAARAAEIDQGAARSADALVEDLRRSAQLLEDAWAACTPEGWTGHGRGTDGALIAVADLPFRRRREVEVHRHDLGSGVPGASAPGEWPRDYVRAEMTRMRMAWKARRPMGLGELPAEITALTEHDQLAWLLGRLALPGVPPADLMR